MPGSSGCGRGRAQRQFGPIFPRLGGRSGNRIAATGELGPERGAEHRADFGAGVDFACNAREVGVFILAGIPCVTDLHPQERHRHDLPFHPTLRRRSRGGDRHRIRPQRFQTRLPPAMHNSRRLPPQRRARRRLRARLRPSPPPARRGPPLRPRPVSTRSWSASTLVSTSPRHRRLCGTPMPKRFATTRKRVRASPRNGSSLQPR